MAGIPFLKLSGLLVKTLAKPVAKSVKELSVEHPLLRRLCVGIGQTTNYVVSRMTHLTTEPQSWHKFRYVEMKTAEALKSGAEILSESIILGVAVSVAVFEFERSARSKAASDERARQKQVRTFVSNLTCGPQEEIDAKLKNAEEKLIEVEALLQAHQQTLHDLTYRRPRRYWFF